MKTLFTFIFLFLFAATANAASISDDFNRADNLDLGANWDAGYSGLQDCQIVNQRVRAQATADVCTETWNANSFIDNQWAEITLGNFSSTGLAEASTLLRSAAPSTQTFYRIVARRGDAGISTAIQKFVAGAFTLLATENAVAWGTGDVLYTDMSSSTITVKRNGTTILTTTDSAIASGRYYSHFC